MFAAGPGLRAQSPVDPATAQRQPAQPAVQKPLTREDAELMLREAHSLIERGQLDDAEKLVSRVEKSRVQFSRLHLGPTPASVRRELTNAQRLRAASKSLSHERANPSKRYLPFARNGNERTPSAATDPFAARNRAASQTPPAAGAPSQFVPPTRSDKRLDAISAPTTLSLDSQPARPKTIDNPFSSAGAAANANSTNIAGQSFASQNELSTPTARLEADANPQNVPSQTPSKRLAPAAPSASNSDPAWELPNAPLPGRAPEERLPVTGGGLAPRRPVANSPTNNARSLNVAPKQQAQENLSAARKALQTGDIDLAEKLTQAANSLGVAESQYLPDEDRPSLVAWDIAQAKQKQTSPQASVARLPNATPRYETRPAQAIEPSAPAQQGREATNQSEFRGYDRYQQSPPTSPVPLPPIDRTAQSPYSTSGNQPRNDGPQMLAALPQSVNEKPARSEVTAPPADELPLPASADAAASASDLPAPTTPTPAATTTPAPIATDNKLAAPIQQPAPQAHSRKSLIDSADDAQQLLMRKLFAEVSKRQSEAIRLREKDSERSLATLREAQQMVNESKLPESQRRELLSRIDKTLHDTQEYVKTHSAKIELEKRNEAVQADVEHDREVKLKLQQKIAELVDEFNRLNHEQRYAESEIVARRLIELAPNDPVAVQVLQNSKFIRREMMNRRLVDAKEQSFWLQTNAVEESAVNPVAEDGKEMVYDAKKWPDLVAKRKGSKERTQRHNERELEIERRLQTPVLLRYQDMPLTQVIGNLSQLTNINIHLDPRGLGQEGVGSDTPVTINLSKEISLKSALNLILEPLHLTYVIHDEVLKVTSEQLRDGELYTVPYNVADLVTPIPNFVPSSNIGLQGLINDSMAAARRGSFGMGASGPAVLVNERGKKPVLGPNGEVLAQQLGSTPAPAPGNGLASSTVPIGSGPGGMGGAANADFDSLIDLITSTVAQDTWAENGGGQAEVRPFPTNLSLVISQTQAVHEQIADLLSQLRRLQDLQVTIEVRFIRLNDTFFERIGVDFQANIKDHGVDPTNVANNPFQPFVGGTLSNTVGLTPTSSKAFFGSTTAFPSFTSDLDVPFRQGSFDAAVPPPFAAFDPGSAANFGFAILSDIEAFFLIQAAQGDSRSNVLNAPKITLFNGQQAFVADATSRPFVVGVIPVVGEFASAQQPVIVVLNEGTMMTIQAVVSDDRRYVRMTIVPFFTQIGNVDTFTFEGTSSSTSSSSTTDDDNNGKNEKNDNTKADTHTGVTVQLPSFSFISVVTTVSVPDGGTVLLGGIKRLSEGRNEFGVPLLSKIPYVNRLFRNVGIGRFTDSLMMMVTPRIIIQEEEEERLGIASRP
jgi:general secretion pathway protein D